MILNLMILLLFQNHVSSAIKFKIPDEQIEKDNSYWYDLGKSDLDFALHKKDITKRAKNVIIFLGDGMGITVTTAGRIYKGQKKGNSGEEESLVWEKFPNSAMMKTYNIDRQVSDSAATATAFFGGVKGNYYTLGLNGNVKSKNCSGSLKDSSRVSSILKWAQEAGKETGFISTARVTHATPAALYAHSAYRYWESDLKLNQDEDTHNCKDIARQLIEDLPGKDINVILAGGRQMMGVALEGDDAEDYRRNDSRNLVNEWLSEKDARGSSSVYVTNNEEFSNINVDTTDFILGLFGGGHMPYNYQRDSSPKGSPSIKELTQTAIKRLSRSDTGFFLMVEGGRIDHALHDTKARVAFEELLAFEEAVQAALELVDEEETLIVVTADHSHVMTINGYPERGNDILGITKYKEAIMDDMPHTTLMFTNGFGANYTWTGTQVLRANVTGMDTRDFDFLPQAAVKMQQGGETHGGEDVAAFAKGPFAHLFHRVHDQTYVAHVMGYAMCVGPYVNECEGNEEQHQEITTEKTAYSVIRDPTNRSPNNGHRSNISVGVVFFMWLAVMLLSAF